MSEEKKTQKVRRIFIPETEVAVPVIAGQPDGPRQQYPYSFWIEFLLNVGPSLNSSNAGRRWSTSIDQKFHDLQTAEDGRKYFDLEQKPQQQWQSLKEAAEKPGVKYPVPSRYLGEYIDSIVEAEEEEVEVE